MANGDLESKVDPGEAAYKKINTKLDEIVKYSLNDYYNMAVEVLNAHMGGGGKIKGSEEALAQKLFAMSAAAYMGKFKGKKIDIKKLAGSASAADVYKAAGISEGDLEEMAVYLPSVEDIKEELQQFNDQLGPYRGVHNTAEALRAAARNRLLQRTENLWGTMSEADRKAYIKHAAGKEDLRIGSRKYETFEQQQALYREARQKQLGDIEQKYNR